MIKEDLKGNLKYNCVKIQSSRPSSASGWTNAIAVRKDTTGDLYGFNDYHFAKLSSGNWYHKPGLTAVLKFNTAPSNSFIWTNEAFDGEYWPPTISYESNIMYLLYKPHPWQHHLHLDWAALSLWHRTFLPIRLFMQ